MKKILLILAVATSISASFGQEFEKVDKSPLDAAYFPQNATKRAFVKEETKRRAMEPKIRILYSRPSMKGREVFGKLVKYGEPWRIGANETTEILFMTDVTFGGKKVKAGRYSLIAIPTEKEWTIKLNSDLDTWGHYSYDKSKDIASITVPTQSEKKTIETLSIALYEKGENLVHIKIGWENTVVELPVTLAN